MTVSAAAEDAIRRIAKRYPSYVGAGVFNDHQYILLLCHHLFCRVIGACTLSLLFSQNLQRYARASRPCQYWLSNNEAMLCSQHDMKRRSVAVVAVDMAGRIGAACHGWTFKYSVRDASMDDVQVG
jgi:hypothetical protein